MNSLNDNAKLNQFNDNDRRVILTQRTNDIVSSVRAKDCELWWDEPHKILEGKTPSEVLTVCPISESAVLLMNAAIHTARTASKIIIF